MAPYHKSITIYQVLLTKQDGECVDNGPFATSDHVVHAGGQAAHWDIQNKENSNLS